MGLQRESTCRGESESIGFGQYSVCDHVLSLLLAVDLSRHERHSTWFKDNASRFACSCVWGLYLSGEGTGHFCILWFLFSHGAAQCLAGSLTSRSSAFAIQQMALYAKISLGPFLVALHSCGLCGTSESQVQFKVSRVVQINPCSLPKPL